MCLVVMPGQCVLVWYCNEAVLLKDISFYDHTKWAGSVSAFNLQAEGCGFKSCSSRENFQIISTPSSYSTCHGLSIKWTRRRLVTDSG